MNHSPIEAITKLCFLESPALQDDTVTFDGVIICGSNEPSMMEPVSDLYMKNRITGPIVISGHHAPVQLDTDTLNQYERLLPVYEEFKKAAASMNIPETDLTMPIITKINQTKKTLDIRKFDQPEYEVFHQYALKLGIPDHHILLERRATNAKENIEYSIELLRDQALLDDMRHILIVAKAFMTRRTQMALRAVPDLPDHLQFAYLPYAADRPHAIRSTDWHQDPVATKRVLEELARIAQYTLKGDLSL